MAKGMVTVAKKNKNKFSSQRNQEEIAKEITPKTDQEISAEFPSVTSEQGVNKKLQQQKKQ
jgi:hypothetical protein